MVMIDETLELALKLIHFNEFNCIESLVGVIENLNEINEVSKLEALCCIAYALSKKEAMSFFDPVYKTYFGKENIENLKKISIEVAINKEYKKLLNIARGIEAFNINYLKKTEKYYNFLYQVAIKLCIKNKCEQAVEIIGIIYKKSQASNLTQLIFTLTSHDLVNNSYQPLSGLLILINGFIECKKFDEALKIHKVYDALLTKEILIDKISYFDYYWGYEHSLCFIAVGLDKHKQHDRALNLIKHLINKIDLNYVSTKFPYYGDEIINSLSKISINLAENKKYEEALNTIDFSIKFSQDSDKCDYQIFKALERIGWILLQDKQCNTLIEILNKYESCEIESLRLRGEVEEYSYDWKDSLYYSLINVIVHDKKYTHERIIKIALNIPGICSRVRSLIIIAKELINIDKIKDAMDLINNALTLLEDDYVCENDDPIWNDIVFCFVETRNYEKALVALDNICDLSDSQEIIYQISELLIKDNQYIKSLIIITILFNDSNIDNLGFIGEDIDDRKFIFVNKFMLSLNNIISLILSNSQFARISNAIKLISESIKKTYQELNTYYNKLEDWDEKNYEIAELNKTKQRLNIDMLLSIVLLFEFEQVSERLVDYINQSLLSNQDNDLGQIRKFITNIHKILSSKNITYDYNSFGQINNLEYQSKDLNIKKEIRRICEKVGIETLIHFTRLENLDSILVHGLLGRLKLQEMTLSFIHNDQQRLDGQLEAICLSVSFPNYQMLYKYTKMQPKERWVILLIDPSVLWELDCKFYTSNAASSSAKVNEKNSDRRHPDAFKQMFDDYGAIRRENLGIPQNFTTNPQAEILVFDDISCKYINKIVFRDLQCAEEWIKLRQQQYTMGLDMDFDINKYYFSPRQDWQTWRII